MDTNVLLDLLGPDIADSTKAGKALEACVSAGGLMLSVVGYAEMASRFSSRTLLDRFLEGFPIEVTDLNQEGAFLAGKLLLDYRKRGGKRERVMADFLVGAHAMTKADRLLTRDKRFFGPSFSRLQVVSPSDLG